jgi:hypothetical protein
MPIWRRKKSKSVKFEYFSYFNEKPASTEALAEPAPTSPPAQTPIVNIGSLPWLCDMAGAGFPIDRYRDDLEKFCC